jgi:hypothetical protein
MISVNFEFVYLNYLGSFSTDYIILRNVENFQTIYFFQIKRIVKEKWIFKNIPFLKKSKFQK